jgi:hypothetical protein
VSTQGPVGFHGLSLAFGLEAQPVLCPKCFSPGWMSCTEAGAHLWGKQLKSVAAHSGARLSFILAELGEFMLSTWTGLGRAGCGLAEFIKLQRLK